MSKTQAIKIVARGDTDSDLELAVEEAVRRWKEGNVRGFDRNESGRFKFETWEDTDTNEDETVEYASARDRQDAADAEADAEHRQDGQDELDRETAERDWNRALGDGRN